MNAFAIALLSICGIGLLALPRRWAMVPLLIGCCYMTLGQGFKIGPFTFTVLRVLVMLGVVRLLVRGERLPGGLNLTDWIIIAFGGWCVFAAVFHHPFKEALVYRLGVAYNVVGFYFLLRAFLTKADDVVLMVKVLAVLLVPIALEMINEKLTGRNAFGFLGGVPLETSVRDDKLRAQGPFGHAILAGTVGGVCLPWMIGLWRFHRGFALCGVFACLAMVVASASSGPIMSTAAGLAAVVYWRWRRYTRFARWAGVAAYLLLELLMNRPAYYIIGEIDLTGSSTGWHRAALIESSIDHLSEWWLAGTDYTRHWMATGVSWSEDHTDITNHYIWYGVEGGLPLMFLFVALIVLSFRNLGRALFAFAGVNTGHQFMIWCIGAALFSHAFTCISVAYFDQSVIFVYCCVAIAATLNATLVGQNGGADIEAPVVAVTPSI